MTPWWNQPSYPDWVNWVILAVIVGTLAIATTGCAGWGLPATEEPQPTDETGPYIQFPRCLFGQGGPWRHLRAAPPGQFVFESYIAVFPNNVELTLKNVLCVIPVDDPVMALGKGKDS